MLSGDLLDAEMRLKDRAAREYNGRREVGLAHAVDPTHLVQA